MVNSAVTTPSSFSSVLVLLISCCRVVTLRLQISGFPSVLCVVWVKQEKRGVSFFWTGKRKEMASNFPVHYLPCADDMHGEQKTMSPLLPDRCSLSCRFDPDEFVTFQTTTDFWASASSLCFDGNQHLKDLWKITWNHLKVSKHTPPFNSLFFFIQGFKWNCPAQLIIQKYSAGGKKKRQHMQPFFHSFLIKLMLRFTSMIGKRQKKPQQVSLDGAKNVWGCRVRGQNGVFVPFVTSHRATGSNFSSFLNFPKSGERLSSKGWIKKIFF